MNKIRLGVVGLGYWGPNLVRNFWELPDLCNLSLICDHDIGQLRRQQLLYPGLKCTDSFAEMLADPEIDAISIATPAHMHYHMALLALKAGKHVLIEKPMASTAGECEHLINEAAAKGLVLMVGHTFLFSPVVHQLRNMILAGAIGKVKHIRSSRLNLGKIQHKGNVVWDLAPHCLSIIDYLLDGKPPVFVNCTGSKNVAGTMVDVANLTVRYGSREMPECVADIHVSWLDPKKVREMVIKGTEGMFVYDDIARSITHYPKCVHRTTSHGSPGQQWYEYRGESASPIVQIVDGEEPLKAEIRHWLTCIGSGESSESCGKKGLNVVRILQASDLSLEMGGSPVAVPKLHYADRIARTLKFATPA